MLYTLQEQGLHEIARVAFESNVLAVKIKMSWYTLSFKDQLDGMQVEGATGDYRTQFDKKAAAAADALISGSAEFVFLHIKAVDDTGHDRQPVLKVHCRGGQLISHIIFQL